jgi:hypothetical protein
LSPINWIGVNYAIDKRNNQKLQDHAKLEIDIIDKNIISVLMDDTIEMRDQCKSVSTTDFFPLDGKMAITDGY